MVRIVQMGGTIILCWVIFSVKSKPVIQEVRLTLAEPSSYHLHEPNGPGTYAFGYDIDDPETENVQFRDEERHANGTVTGRYGWMAPDGTVYMVDYISDTKGYRANVKTLPNYRMYRSRNSKRSSNAFIPS